MKRAIALLLTAAVAAVGFGVMPSFASTRTVRVDDNFFKPTRLSVAKGTTIAFAFKGINLHNVTRSKGPAFKKCGDRTSGTCRRTLRTAGTYRLFCSIHDFRMRIIVG